MRAAGEWNGFENQHALTLAADAENSIAEAEDGEVRLPTWAATPSRTTSATGNEEEKAPYAEIKAIASGNPAVMEKVKIDSEVRKLDQLRAVHRNQQHKIRWWPRQDCARSRCRYRRADTGPSFFAVG